tara:strand:+ start:28575 stop:29087 length:513 start_codon:yes stop_codon:yes gene_type:complete
MDLETAIIAFGFGWGAWILYRIHQRRSSKEDPSAAIIKKPADEQAEMPRVGTPASITFNQIKALQANNFTPDKNWSQEEAALILDAVKYLRAVCRSISSEDDGEPPLEIQNALLKFILTKQDIRDYVRKWGEDRRAQGLGEYADDEPLLQENGQYERVKTEAQKYFTENL